MMWQPIAATPGQPSKQGARPVERAFEQRLLFSGSFGTAQGPVPVSLYFAGTWRKLMSYNAENFYAGQDGTPIKSLESIQALADVILRQDPDVIALQEVGDKHLLSWFNEQYLQGRYRVVTSPTASPQRIGVAFLCKPNIRLLQRVSHGAGLHGGASGKRDLLEATFETETGYRFTILNIHCKSMVGSKSKRILNGAGRRKIEEAPNREELIQEIGRHDERETLAARLKEVIYGARVVESHLDQDPKAHIFWTGDFNTLPDTCCGKQVLDIVQLLHKKKSHRMTEVMLKDGLPVPTHGAALFPASKLDYTFVSRRLLKRIRHAFVDGNAQMVPWSQASDHLPLITEFEEPDRSPGPRKKLDRIA